MNPIKQMWNTIAGGFELMFNQAANPIRWVFNKPPGFSVAKWLGTGPTPLDRFVLIENLGPELAAMMATLESFGDDLYDFIRRQGGG